MNKINNQKKIFSKIIVVAIPVLLIGIQVSASIPINSKNYNEFKDIYSFFNNIDDKENLENIEKSNIYHNFKKIIGNDSEIHFCGPAYIYSNGTGLHMARLIKLIRLRIPIEIPQPDIFGFERRLMNMWFVFCSYNNESATTIIKSLNKNETITIKGKHMVFACVFLFPHPSNLREKINNITGRLFNKTIDFPLLNITGKMFWNWSFPIYFSLTMAQFFSPIKIKMPLYGFKKSLDFYSYTPFVIWTNSSLIK